jgi:hypothetical protein
LGNDCLSGRKISCIQKHHLTVSIASERVHFAVGGNLVNAGVSAGIRGKDKPRIDSDGNAIGHGDWP